MVDDRQQGALRAPQRRGSALRRAPARLAATGLGVSWERVGAGRYDIVGIPRAVRGEFSSRSAEIRSELATVGRPSRSRRTAAWASTREPKGYVGDDAQRAGWADRVEALGLEPKDLAAVVPTRADPGNTARPDGSLDEVEFAQLLGRSADGVVTRRAVVEAWARASPDGASAVQIDAAAEVWAPTHGELGVSERPTASGAMVLSAAVLERLGRGLRSQTARLATRPQRPGSLPTVGDGGSRARGECRHSRIARPCR